jgi:hypothetical protein
MIEKLVAFALRTQFVVFRSSSRLRLPSVLVFAHKWLEQRALQKKQHEESVVVVPAIAEP